ncbi:MAG: hypothetical protein ACPGD8_03250, partial [Flavobacteriales bacterium]
MHCQVRLLFLPFFLVCIFGCHQPQSTYAQRVFCNAETVKEGKFVSEEGELLNQGNLQSDKVAFSGSYSVELQKDSEYGFTYHVNDVKEGERFKLKVKRYSKSGSGSLVLAAKRIKLGFFSTSQALTKKNANGWDELELNAT